MNKTILICIGSGIGNAILQLPLVRFLENRGFYCHILLRNMPPNSKVLFEKLVGVKVFNYEEKNPYEYDLVFMTRSFTGSKSIDVDVKADLILSSSSIFGVEEYDLYDETEYEFVAMSRLIGCKFTSEDLRIPEVQLSNEHKSLNRVALFTSGKNTLPASKRNLKAQDLQKIVDFMYLHDFDPVSIGTKGEVVPRAIDETSNDPNKLIKSISSCKYFIATDMGLVWLARLLGVNGTVFLGPTSVLKTEKALLNNGINVIRAKGMQEICPIFPCWKQRNTVQAKFSCSGSCMSNLVNIETLKQIVKEIH